MQNEELHRAQAAAQESSDKYCDLFDFAPTGYFMLDEDGRILEVNLAGAALLALDRSVVVKKRFLQFVAMEDRTKFAEYCRRVFQANAKQSGEFELRDGERTIHALVEGIAVRNTEGKATGCRFAVTDITEHKRAESSLQHLNEVLRAVRDIGELIVRERDPDRLLADACHALMQARGYRLVWIGGVVPGSQRVVPLAGAGPAVDYLRDVTITWDESETGRGPVEQPFENAEPPSARIHPPTPGLRRG